MSLKCILQGQDSKNLATKEELNEHIEDKNNPHEVTIEQIGAAPSGYGLGSSSGKLITDCNEATQGGFYYWQPPVENAPFDYGVMIVIPNTAGGGNPEVTQIASRSWDVIASSLAVRKSDGNSNSWGDWEYINPPMLWDTEYKTAKHYQKRAVYQKLGQGDIIYERVEGEDSWQPVAKRYGGFPYQISIDSTSEDGLNAATEAGVYIYGGAGGTKNTPPLFPLSDYGSVVVISRGGSSSTNLQFAISEVTPGERSRCGFYATRRYLVTDNEWSDWEYVNPYMQYGVEYETLERYNGKPVYTKMINCGALPNAGQKRVAHGVTVEDMLRCSAHCTSGYLDTLPYWYSPTDYCMVYASNDNIYFYDVTDLSNRNATAQIWYTKPTEESSST